MRRPSSTLCQGVAEAAAHDSQQRDDEQGIIQALRAEEDAGSNTASLQKKAQKLIIGSSSEGCAASAEVPAVARM